MMRNVIESDAFRKDKKKLMKRGKDTQKLFRIVEALAKGEPLAEKHRTHKLTGN